jgi:hypothetical protein
MYFRLVIAFLLIGVGPAFGAEFSIRNCADQSVEFRTFDDTDVLRLVAAAASLLPNGGVGRFKCATEACQVYIGPTVGSAWVYSRNFSDDRCLVYRRGATIGNFYEMVRMDDPDCGPPVC